jgi:hypothetical protein
MDARTKWCRELCHVLELVSQNLLASDSLRIRPASIRSQLCVVDTGNATIKPDVDRPHRRLRPIGGNNTKSTLHTVLQRLF